MKYIITSGPMEMKIDNVRKIENSSTGSLGVCFAEEILKKYPKAELVYIHTKAAKTPLSDAIKKIEITNHDELINALKTEITDKSTIIHAMAISDFGFGGNVTITELAQNLYANWQQFESEDQIADFISKQVTVSDKLSSKSDQILILNRAIKVIDEIKQINPNAKLVGFKLLSNVGVDELITVGQNIKNRANCDLVVANIKEHITNDSHQAFIISDDEIREVNTKQEIARNVIELLGS